MSETRAKMADDDKAEENMELVEQEEDEEESADMGEENGGEQQVYLPGQPLDEGEELVMDDSAYVMYHQAHTGAPCLSFDILPDQLGDDRRTFPMTCYMVAGTQAQRAHTNSVIVMKMSNLHRNKEESGEKDDNDSDSDSDDDSDDEKTPDLEAAMIKHIGSVNRIRAVNLENKVLAASWSETGKVHIWDLTRPLEAVNDSQVMSTYTRTQESPAAVFTFPGHQVEGYAVAWSATVQGRLASGDCNKNIHIWNPQQGGSWHVDQRPYTAHTASVEDIQWSPNEAPVFASCSVDKSVRIWDCRASPNKACMLTASEAHDRDVNVISWNSKEPFILSGGDDGIIKVWDLRQFHSGKPVALFKHHTAPITSIEWHPTESTIFAASGSDDQITLWDLAVERDPEAAGSTNDQEPDVPPQLLFVHQGQTDIKELHWHRQLPGVILSTAHSGFNIFRTISV